MARIVKISDMTDDEKNKWIDQVNTRYQERIINSKTEQEKANAEFNRLTNGTNYSNSDTAKQRSNLILNNQNRGTVLSASGNTIGNKRKTDVREIAKAQNKDFIEGLTNILNPNSWINKTISNDRMSNKEQKKTVENDNLLKLIQNANIAKEKRKEDINTDTQNTILPIPTNKTDKKASIWNKKVDTNGKEINNLTVGQQFEKSRRILPIFAENVGIGASSVLPSIANYKNAVNQLSYEGLVNKGLVDYNADNIVYKRQEYLDKKENEKSRKIEENINEILPYDNASKKLATIAPSIGENLVSMGVGSVSHVLGSTSFMLSAAGNYLNDAKARGMSTDKAFGYATVMGIAEGGSEALISANMLSSSKKLVTGTGISKKVLGSIGMNIGENFFQEAIMEPLQEATAQAIGGKDTANWNNIWGRMLESGLDGVLSALLLQGASVGIASSVSVMDKLNNKIVPTTQEYMKALVDIQNSGKVNTKEIINGAVIATIDGINENNTLNTKQEQLNNNINTQTQQVTPQENKMVQNGLSEQMNNSIANSQKTLYNNIESESGINGRINQRNDGTSRLFKESTKNQRQYDWNEYNKWEQSIKPISKENITNKEQQSISKSKIEHNKDIFIFNENNNDNTYSGGASRNVKNKINISRQQAEYFGLDFMIDHETIESDILQNRELYNDIVKPVIDKIKQDNNFNKQIEEFWKNEIGNRPSDNLIAKDIFCDRFAQIRGNELKYENVLSQETNMTIDYSLNNFYKQIYGKELEKTSSFNLPIPEKTMKDIGLPTLQDNTVGEKINWNEIERPEGKFRKHYRSIIESNNTTPEAKKIAKEVMQQDTYIPDSNTKQLQKADEIISMSGADVELNSMMSKAINNEKITAVDVAVGERLIEYYSKTGDAQKLQDAIQTTAMVGTQLGQAVQAMSILNHQTPQGQVVWIQRSIDKMNNQLKQKRGENAPQFNLTDNMIERILHSENEQQMNKNLDAVYKELGQQVHKSNIEQLDSWRYFAMLGNFRTHIRNMTGNFLMGMAQDTKNKVVGVIESTVAKFVPNMEKTQTIKIPSKEVIEFAKNDIQNVLPQLEGNNKYNPKNALESNMRTFKSNALENTLGRLFNWNDNLLEAEDGLGLKSGYKKALAQYITANNIDINNITDNQLAKARNYAIKQAQERTFHQANVIASAINSFTKKNKVTKAIGDAILPFVKTPANVAKTGIEYSPVGLTKAIVYDTVQLRKGNISINQYIDNLSKGLTGSAITVLGYALAQAGILKAGGSDDDKKEKFDEQSGKQAYSIQVGDKTYSIDWLAPVGIPLMVGAEIYEGLTQKSDEKTSKATDDEETLNKFLDRAEVLTNSLTSTLDPMVEMSMVSSLVSSIKSFAQGDTQTLANMLTNMGKSYINQYVPTLLGQIAKTTDTVERDTISTKSGTLSKAIDGTINQVKSKVPILRQTLPVRTDIWGEEQKLSDDWAKRFFEAGILPMNIKNIKNNKVVNELNNLYDRTGESSILPTTINKKITIDGQDYRLTNQEYNKYKTMYGRNSYKLINELVKSNNYKKMTDIEKQTAIEEIYTYVKEQNKIDYCKNNNLEYKESTLSKVVNKLNNEASNYFEYRALTKYMKKDKEKINVLVNASYSDRTKEIIYKESINSKDKKTQLVDKLGLPLNQYLKYKQQEFENDKDVEGDSISGTNKQKVYNYLNNIPNKELSIPYKQIICKLENINDYNSEIARYIIDKNITQKDKKELLEILGFKVDKSGNIKN